MAFTLLILVNVLIALAAFLRLRPMTLIFALSHVQVLRALLEISEHGQPSAQSFVPTYVFNAAALGTAANVLGLSTAALLVAPLVVRSLPRAAPPTLPTLPRPVLWLIGAFCAFEIVTGGTIATTNYGDMASGVNFGGLYPFIHTVVLYEVYRRVVRGELTPARAFAFIFAFIFFTQYAKGGTGMATGILITAACMLFGREPPGVRRWLKAGGLIGGVFLLSFGVRAVRGSLSERGTSAIGDYATTVASGDALQNDNADQSAAHVLECISLYDSGRSREWRSVYLPFVYSLEPSFLLKPLGIVRPREAPWELGDYFIQGGGIQVIGELYWNGGYLCVLIVSLALAFVSVLLDVRASRGFVWTMVLCQAAPNLLMGFQYGLSQVSRGFFNGLLASAMYVVIGSTAAYGNARLASARRQKMPGFEAT